MIGHQGRQMNRDLEVLAARAAAVVLLSDVGGGIAPDTLGVLRYRVLSWRSRSMSWWRLL
jgi:hypothetical protein